MANALSHRQKREKKKKKDRKLQAEVNRIREQELLSQQAQQIVQHQKAMQQQQAMGVHGPQGNMVVNYIADRNGCGYYRAIWPFELLATYKNIMAMNSFVYQMDPNILQKVSTFRFQRQATDSQKLAWDKYCELRGQYNFKLQYEIDDLLMEIQPHNEIAYKYFDAKKKTNHLRMLDSADSITFSTEPLKDIYVNKYQIDPNKIKVVKNYLPQFLYSLPYRTSVKDFTKDKPRILWWGSASHLGKGGDLDFLIPMIESTIEEYQWVFQGVIPKELEQYVKEGKIEFLPWVPVYGLANIQFYKAKPDICLAPLTPNVFNTCKSDLKYLESCALGAPCITTSFSDTVDGLKSPYEDDAEICLEPDPDIWKSMIDHLISDPDYYIETVKSQYTFINGRWMENNLDQWADAINHK
jgi:hypothetical protein